MGGGCNVTCIDVWGGGCIDVCVKAMYEWNLITLLPKHLRPDGQKKAYVRLTSDYDALDVANKVGCMSVSEKAPH